MNLPDRGATGCSRGTITNVAERIKQAWQGDALSVLRNYSTGSPMNKQKEPCSAGLQWRL
jgi:hypothetical protein